ncbi:hypothetical protein EJB05_00322 [Eragrostis curvula]|uniref:Uncharacterized protein n=1 Tax=Eragrostis curvula TaxID=38414 RepID=A0A5J9WLQ6_9POAL|nr:hypothetical protein EJB05_00322 [Eragrostis curvula]
MPRQIAGLPALPDCQFAIVGSRQDSCHQSNHMSSGRKFAPGSEKRRKKKRQDELNKSLEVMGFD